MKLRFCQTIVLLLLVFLSACSNELVFNNIARVNYGTSFGECVGYCKHEVTLSSNKATYKCSSWNPTVQTITKEDSIRVSALDSICKVDTTSFFDLPETIGCPDCADGGAEWLEIEMISGKTHKVTFEYHNEPALLKDQISKLRELLGKNACE